MFGACYTNRPHVTIFKLQVRPEKKVLQEKQSMKTTIMQQLAQAKGDRKVSEI